MSKIVTMFAMLQDATAQDSSGAGAAGGPQPSFFDSLMGMMPAIVLCYFVFYFLLIRPQKKQQQEQQALLDNVKKNDTVQTSSGILGKVVSVDRDKDIVVLKIDEQNNTRMRVLRSSIQAIVTDGKKSDGESESRGENEAKQKAEVG